MDIEGVLFEGITFSPDSVEHFLAGEDTTGRFEELPENLEFFRSQIDRTVVDLDFMTIKIHVNVPHAEVSVRIHRTVLPSQDGARPRDQFTHTLVINDKIDILFVFLNAFLLYTGNTAFLHSHDGDRVQPSKFSEARDGTRVTVDNNQ